MFARFIAILILATITACADESHDADHTQLDIVDTSNTGQAYFLDPSELAAQMELARAGDNKAAVRISEHYSFAELQPDNELPWLIMAAERGHIGAMNSLGYRYGSGMYQTTDCRKAVEWLERAKREGTKTELDNLGVAELLADITRNDASCPGHAP